MAGSVTLDFSSSTRTSVTFSYSGTGWKVPSDDETPTEPSSKGSWSSGDTSQTRTGTASWTMYSRGETTWSWTFTGGNGGSSSSKTGTKTISGFSSGVKTSVKGTLSVTRSSKKATRTWKQTRTRTKTEKGSSGEYEYGDWVEGSWSVQSTTYVDGTTKNLGSASDTLSFYTRPAEFSWSTTPSSGAYIIDCLSATKWNDLMDKAIQKKNWKNQTASSDSSNHVSGGDWITASVYNAGAALCGVSTRVTADSTIIAASHFTALSTAVNSE